MPIVEELNPAYLQGQLARDLLSVARVEVQHLWVEGDVLFQFYSPVLPRREMLKVAESLGP